MKDNSPNFEKDDLEDVFDDSIKGGTKKCPTCGADVESDAQYCPYCGAQLGESTKIQEADKKPVKPAVIAPRPLKKGEKVEKSAAPTKEYKYGDGYSVSALALGALWGCWLYPVIAFIISMCGLSTKNPKDKKLFKIAAVLSIVFLIVHIVVIILGIQGKL